MRIMALTLATVSISYTITAQSNDISRDADTDSWDSPVY